MSADDHTDELHKPLGQDPKRKKPFVLPVPVVVRSIAGILGLCVAVLIGWILFVDEPFGGEPVALVSAATAQGNKSAEQSAPQAKPNSAPVALADSDKPSGRTVTIIDGSTGKRQEVTVGANGRLRDGRPGRSLLSLDQDARACKRCRPHITA